MFVSVATILVVLHLLVQQDARSGEREKSGARLEYFKCLFVKTGGCVDFAEI